MLSIETPLLLGQAVAEDAGAAATGAALAGAAGPMAFAPPMGGEEVSAMLSAALAEHAAQFLPVAALGVLLRGMLSGTIGTGSAVYTAMTEIGSQLLGL